MCGHVQVASLYEHRIYGLWSWMSAAVRMRVVQSVSTLFVDYARAKCTMLIAQL